MNGGLTKRELEDIRATSGRNAKVHASDVAALLHHIACQEAELAALRKVARAAEGVREAGDGEVSTICNSPEGYDAVRKLLAASATVKGGVDVEGDAAELARLRGLSYHRKEQWDDLTHQRDAALTEAATLRRVVEQQAAHARHAETCPKASCGEADCECCSCGLADARTALAGTGRSEFAALALAAARRFVAERSLEKDGLEGTEYEMAVALEAMDSNG